MANDWTGNAFVLIRSRLKGREVSGVATVVEPIAISYSSLTTFDWVERRGNSKRKLKGPLTFDRLHNQYICLFKLKCTKNQSLKHFCLSILILLLLYDLHIKCKNINYRPCLLSCIPGCVTKSL